MNTNVAPTRTDQEANRSVAYVLSAGRRVRYRSFFSSLILTTFALLVDIDPLAAQQAETAVINREHKIKAAYIYNFARYVEWPEHTFKDPKEPFVIGVVGSDPIRQNLEKLAETKKVDGRPILVKLFAKPADVVPCPILFLSPSLKPEVQKQVMQKLAGKNVLFVGQASDFLSMGGVIDFVVRQNRVRLIVALKAAQRENLKVSSKLLRVAEVVKR